MRAASRHFPPRNRYGVVAYGIRKTRSGGLTARTYGLTVYVLRKKRAPTHVARSFVVTHAGRRLRVVPDVIGTGAAPSASAGNGTPFTGLHVGAAIQISETRELASVGCLLGSDDGPKYLLTAGHVFGGGAADRESVWASPDPDEEASCIGHLVANLLDRRDQKRVGLDGPIDAALVELTEGGVAIANATSARFSVGGVMKASSADQGDAQIFSWASGDFSPDATVTSLPTAVHFSSAPRGSYTVEGVLGTDPRITDPGDSGTALLSADEERLLIGVCVGAYRVQSNLRARRACAARSPYDVQPAASLEQPHLRTNMRAIAAFSFLSLLFARLAWAAPPDQPKDDRKAEGAVGGTGSKEPAKADNIGDDSKNKTAPTCTLAVLLERGTCPIAAPSGPELAASASAQVLQKLAEGARLAPTSTGGAQGLALDAINEAVQILGQIVVDRASQEAFRQLQNKLVDLLGCNGSGKEILPMTCEAIQTLRIQDIATAPQVLSSALLADIAAQLFKAAKADLDAKSTAKDAKSTAKDANSTAKELLSIIQRDIAPLIFRGDHGIDLRMAPLSVSQLRAQGLQNIRRAETGLKPPSLCKPTTDPEKANAALGFAAAATAACFLQQDDVPANCPGPEVVSTLFEKVCGSDGDRAIEKAGSTLAVDLIAAATAADDRGNPDGKRRLRAANDGLWDYLCLSVDFTDGCPVTAQQPKTQWALASLHAIFGSAIEGDKLETVVRERRRSCARCSPTTRIRTTGAAACGCSPVCSTIRSPSIPLRRPRSRARRRLQCRSPICTSNARRSSSR